MGGWNLTGAKDDQTWCDACFVARFRPEGASFRLVYDWAGIAWGRSSSLITSFADANREAIQAGADRRVRVYAITPSPGNANDPDNLGILVAEYEPSNGRARCVHVSGREPRVLPDDATPVEGSDLSMPFRSRKT